MSDRAVSPVIGVVLLIAVTVIAAVALGVTVFGITRTEPPPQATFTLSADSATQTITLTHRGGAAIDPASLRLRIAVDGEPIAHQPPIPFFASEGFMSGPTGPFNSEDEGEWITGQSASVQLASTNTRFQAGSVISVRLYVDDKLLITLETRADYSVGHTIFTDVGPLGSESLGRVAQPFRVQSEFQMSVSPIFETNQYNPSIVVLSSS